MDLLHRRRRAPADAAATRASARAAHFRDQLLKTARRRRRESARREFQCPEPKSPLLGRRRHRPAADRDCGHGQILQLKKHWTLGAARGTARQHEAADGRAERHSGGAEEASARSRSKHWAHVKRIDVRPDRGVAKAWLHTDYEAQVDLGTAEILQIAYRRSDWIESIHDGSIFGDTVKLCLFFPAAIGWCCCGSAACGCSCCRSSTGGACGEESASRSPTALWPRPSSYPTFTVISVASSDGSDVPRYVADALSMRLAADRLIPPTAMSSGSSRSMPNISPRSFSASTQPSV